MITTPEEKPDFETILEDEAQGRYPVNETTRELYVGSKITFTLQRMRPKEYQAKVTVVGSKRNILKQ